ncbi:glyoxalase [Amycolatopsis australiensis]|uniref:Predicted lactoylglutathione lyase n=1 Tax=Amycolatopsis australiensis TaxID=546364 RepID=A0A1K1RHN4_9PSEU|nr:glyoxalase [Amycolatopsis australiensis]SFW71533.1 Predicted lactoylglutathione lyase [Amycolatopsis australiensis]
MTNIDSLTLEVADTAAAARFYTDAFGLTSELRFRTADQPSDGFRGFTLSLTVAQPGDVDSLIGTALEAGATSLKPAAKSMWGYGGAVRAPDGAVWTIATSAKKNTGPVTREFDAIVLLLGVADVAASKKFYVGHGLTVAKSFGRMYVEFDAGAGPIKLALYRRKALAKQAGVSPEGSGSHRIAVHTSAGSFTDPDGFAWEVASPQSLDA